MRPEWYHRDDDRGIIKVIMTGSASDDVSWQEHIRTKPRRRVLGDRMKDPADPLKIAIVRDMWLTGFDAPSLHTMYIDKPMRSHGLMQAIARVNRVFKDKKGGLVVDYLGIADELKKAFALAVPHEEALKIRDEVGFFQVVRSGLAKTTVIAGKPQEELDSAIRQIISKAIVSDKVIDIFDTVGLKKPDISILLDEFLAEVKRMPHKNLAFELLRKLLNDEIKTRSKKNLIQGKSFAEMLEKAIKRYQNKSIETAQIIEELIELAKEMREARLRGEKLNLNEEELAFYDALEVNDSAVKVLGDEKLVIIARELVDTVRKNVTIDWTLKESVQAKLICKDLAEV